MIFSPQWHIFVKRKYIKILVFVISSILVQVNIFRSSENGVQMCFSFRYIFVQIKSFHSNKNNLGSNYNFFSVDYIYRERCVMKVFSSSLKWTSSLHYLIIWCDCIVYNLY